MVVTLNSHLFSKCSVLSTKKRNVGRFETLNQSVRKISSSTRILRNVGVTTRWLKYAPLGGDAACRLNQGSRFLQSIEATFVFPSLFVQMGNFSKSSERLVQSIKGQTSSGPPKKMIHALKDVAADGFRLTVNTVRALSLVDKCQRILSQSTAKAVSRINSVFLLLSSSHRLKNHLQAYGKLRKEVPRFQSEREYLEEQKNTILLNIAQTVNAIALSLLICFSMIGVSVPPIAFLVFSTMALILGISSYFDQNMPASPLLPRIP